MLIEAAKGGHTPVVGLLLDYPRSIVMATPPASSLAHPQQQQQHQVSLEHQDLGQVPVQLGAASMKNAAAVAAANSLKLRKTQRPAVTAGTVKPVETGKVVNAKTGLVAGSTPLVHESAGYDFIEGSGYVIEGKKMPSLERLAWFCSYL
jgi:hypothetical protein